MDKVIFQPNIFAFMLYDAYFGCIYCISSFSHTSPQLLQKQVRLLTKYLQDCFQKDWLPTCVQSYCKINFSNTLSKCLQYEWRQCNSIANRTNKQALLLWTQIFSDLLSELFCFYRTFCKIIKIDSNFDYLCTIQLFSNQNHTHTFLEFLE